jgi:hemerythrin
MPVEIPVLPVAFMNEDHRHAADQLATMLAVLPSYGHSREPLVQACRAFLEHNREHFAREEAAMRESGFPPYVVHKSEHDRTLAWLAELVAGIEAGLDTETVRNAIERDIPTWLIQHIQTMDRATAGWIDAHQPASGMRV